MLDMPSKASLYDGQCRLVGDFGTGPRNFVHFNPQGNLVCFGGFGNLAGSVEIWDLKSLAKIASFNAAGTSTCNWSPDGRLLVLATLSPRLRVDNCFKIYDYSGSLLVDCSFKDLFQVSKSPHAHSDMCSMLRVFCCL